MHICKRKFVCLYLPLKSNHAIISGKFHFLPFSNVPPLLRKISPRLNLKNTGTSLYNNSYWLFFPKLFRNDLFMMITISSILD